LAVSILGASVWSSRVQPLIVVAVVISVHLDSSELEGDVASLLLPDDDLSTDN